MQEVAIWYEDGVGVLLMLKQPFTSGQTRFVQARGGMRIKQKWSGKLSTEMRILGGT
jgi:hypothetical protein